jgi:hypothetical protein
VEVVAVRVECEKKILGKFLFSLLRCRRREEILEEGIGIEKKELDPVPRLKKKQSI